MQKYTHSKLAAWGTFVYYSLAAEAISVLMALAESVIDVWNSLLVCIIRGTEFQYIKKICHLLTVGGRW